MRERPSPALHPWAAIAGIAWLALASGCATGTTPGVFDVGDSADVTEETSIPDALDGGGDETDAGDNPTDAADADAGDGAGPDGGEPDTDADGPDSADAGDTDDIDGGDATGSDADPDAPGAAVSAQRPAPTSGGGATSSARFRARIAVGGPAPGGTAVSPRFRGFFGVSLP